jgi:hypothetical protein
MYGMCGQIWPFLNARYSSGYSFTESKLEKKQFNPATLINRQFACLQEQLNPRVSGTMLSDYNVVLDWYPVCVMFILKKTCFCTYCSLDYQVSEITNDEIAAMPFGHAVKVVLSCISFSRNTLPFYRRRALATCWKHRL